MSIKKANQGYMNTNNKSSDKHPDFRAEVPVDSSFIKGLADAATGEGAVIYVAGWKGVSQKTGDDYIFVKLDSIKFQKAGTVTRSDSAAPASEDMPF